jgi:hypothetical protein
VAGQIIIRKGATELEKRSRREETMRTLRWAAELAVELDERKAQLGLAQLNALGESDMLDDAEQLFVDAALESVLREPIDELEEAGPGARVYYVSVQDLIGETDIAGSTVESENRREGGTDD